MHLTDPKQEKGPIRSNQINILGLPIHYEIADERGPLRGHVQMIGRNIFLGCPASYHCHNVHFTHDDNEKGDDDDDGCW